MATQVKFNRSAFSQTQLNAMLSIENLTSNNGTTLVDGTFYVPNDASSDGLYLYDGTEKKLVLIGNKNTTPVTSVKGSAGSAKTGDVEITPADLGLASAYKFQGTKADYATLKAYGVENGATVGDVWNVSDTGMNYAAASVTKVEKDTYPFEIGSDTYNLGDGDTFTANVYLGSTAKNNRTVHCKVNDGFCFLYVYNNSKYYLVGNFYTSQLIQCCQITDMSAGIDGFTSKEQLATACSSAISAIGSIDNMATNTGTAVASGSYLISWDALGSSVDLTGKQDKITASGILKGDGAGGVTAAEAGTDYAKGASEGNGLAYSGGVVSMGAASSSASGALSSTDYQNIHSNGMYAKVDNGATTAAKTTTVKGFVLQTGSRIAVQFINGNSATEITLNVSSTGDKFVMYNGANIGTNINKASIYELIYDGTYWQVIGRSDIDADANVGITTIGEFTATKEHSTIYLGTAKGLSMDTNSGTLSVAVGQGIQLTDDGVGVKNGTGLRYDAGGNLVLAQTDKTLEYSASDTLAYGLSPDKVASVKGQSEILTATLEQESRGIITTPQPAWLSTQTWAIPTGARMILSILGTLSQQSSYSVQLSSISGAPSNGLQYNGANVGDKLRQGTYDLIFDGSYWQIIGGMGGGIYWDE